MNLVRRARRLPRSTRIALAVGGVAALLVACAGSGPARPPVELAPDVDIGRFMGRWYVIASIPTVFERGAHGAVESYKLNADGSIATDFSYSAGSFDGPRREFSSTGFVLGPNAVWGQQYVWPIKADYRISYVAPDYAHTVITREKRDYVWIMSRTPTMPEDELQRLIAFVARQGYDTAKLERVPQR